MLVSSSCRDLQPRVTDCFSVWLTVTQTSEKNAQRELQIVSCSVCSQGCSPRRDTLFILSMSVPHRQCWCLGLKNKKVNLASVWFGVSLYSGPETPHFLRDFSSLSHSSKRHWRDTVVSPTFLCRASVKF